MDNGKYIAALEAITYAQIVAQGMTAENEQRDVYGRSMVYDEEAFVKVAEEMRFKVNRCFE
jgi:hypothetical protein